MIFRHIAVFDIIHKIDKISVIIATSKEKGIMAYKFRISYVVIIASQCMWSFHTEENHFKKVLSLSDRKVKVRYVNYVRDGSVK